MCTCVSVCLSANAPHFVIYVNVNAVGNILDPWAVCSMGVCVYCTGDECTDLRLDPKGRILHLIFWG